MLSDDVLLKAGHYCYCLEYADVFEEHGGSFGAGAQIEHCVEEAPAGKLLPIMREDEKKLVEGWGKPVEEVARLMDMDTEKGQIDLVYYALAACRGHGIGLQDDHKDNLDLYHERTGEPLDPSPFNTEFMDLNDLALDELETPDPEFAIYEGDDLVEGKFHSVEAAERWLSDTGMGYKPEDRAKYEIFEMVEEDAEAE